MNEPKKKSLNNKERNNNKNNDCKIIELNKNLINTNLSQSIKIFNHKSNNILGLKTNLSSNRSEKNILKKNIVLNSLKETKMKNIIDKKNNLLLYSFEFGKKEKDEKNKNINLNKNNYLEIKKEKRPNKTNLFNNNNLIFSQNITNKNSTSNIFVNNEYISSKLKDNTTKSKNIKKNKLIKNIEDAKFKIILLNNISFNTNKKYFQFKLENEKKKNKENLLLLKKKFKKEEYIHDKLLYLYKLKLLNIEENYINANKFKEDIQKEDLIFKMKKCVIIEKIMEIKIIIHQNKTNNLDYDNKNKTDKSSFGINNDIDIDDMSTDEMLITKNKNICKINYFYPNKYK